MSGRLSSAMNDIKADRNRDTSLNRKLRWVAVVHGDRSYELPCKQANKQTERRKRFIYSKDGSVASVPASKQGKASTVERKSAEGLSKERNIAARENSKQKGRKQKAQSGSNESVKSGEQKRKNQKKPDKPQDGAHPNSAEGGTIEETDGLYEDVELNRGTESVFIPSYK
nr:unnamed protein product [Haemonchus contortus]